MKIHPIQALGACGNLKGKRVSGELVTSQGVVGKVNSSVLITTRCICQGITRKI